MLQSTPLYMPQSTPLSYGSLADMLSPQELENYSATVEESARAAFLDQTKRVVDLMNEVTGQISNHAHLSNGETKSLILKSHLTVFSKMHESKEYRPSREDLTAVVRTTVNTFGPFPGIPFSQIAGLEDLQSSQSPNFEGTNPFFVKITTLVGLILQLEPFAIREEPTTY